MVDAAGIAEYMAVNLDKVGQKIIKKYRLNARHSQETGVDSYPHDQKFFEKPNGMGTVRREYHYWGIRDHSYKVLLYQEDAKDLVKQWGAGQVVKERLAEKVGNNTKGDLIKLASVLHDVGKFACRYLQWRDGKLVYRFTNHEVMSGKIIREELAEELMYLGLTAEEVEYVAVLAERHYELARVRINNKQQFNWDFVNSDYVGGMLQEIRNDNSRYDIEVGLMFLADSLAKTKYNCVTPEEAEFMIRSGQVNPPEHAPAVRQQPLKIKLAERYFKQMK